MSHASLAARYRPQSFAEVAGQETVKTILSRAAAEDRIAPAYLLSGTRGVGKTTIARIFAKALNCVHAPGPEPCNECEQCRRITRGNHVDVVEIDGASNRGIDDARRLREAIAYAPMEGRYKVFIIDEAHMLTRDAFNALLKTLEEPPARSTFILATTEPHKFPVTIVSRCQHFTFRALSENALFAHLVAVLHKEGAAFEDGAVRLIARRAGGSVRDGMSLLGQSLALGDSPLTEDSVRDVLGLAGQEMFERLLQALETGDCAAVVLLVRELLEQGADLGFFLGELAGLWRNLFLLRHSGEAAFAALELPDAERRRLLEAAQQFDLAYIHAAWQMVLESRRQVLNSPEPASALELLLLNLVLLPRLVSLESLSRVQQAPVGTGRISVPPRTPGSMPPPSSVAAAPEVVNQGTPSCRTAAPPHCCERPATSPSATNPASHAPKAAPSENGGGNNAGCLPEADGRGCSTVPSIQSSPTEPKSGKIPSWEGFLEYCAAHMPAGQGLGCAQLRSCRGTFIGNILELRPQSELLCDQLNADNRPILLRRLAEAYAGGTVDVKIPAPEKVRKTEAELKQELAGHSIVRLVEQTFDASLVRCIPSDTGIADAVSAARHRGKTSKETSEHAQHE